MTLQACGEVADDTIRSPLSKPRNWNRHVQSVCMPAKQIDSGEAGYRLVIRSFTLDHLAGVFISMEGF